MTPPTLVLRRADVAELLSMDACIDAVERAFVAHARGHTDAPGVLGAHVAHGGFHVKTAGMAGRGAPHRFVAKVNANFPGNPARHGLPTIQGVIALFDAECGALLALIDSIEITALRTAAATAVAAKHLARADASTITIVGCGVQGASQLRAVSCVRSPRRVFAIDRDPARAASFADALSRELDVEIAIDVPLGDAARASDIVVTCTPSREALLHDGDVAPGAFVAAVGADHPEKQEIAPSLMASSVVIVDVLEQCATIGDLHHAIAAGTMTRGDVRADLAAVIAGDAHGRAHDDEIVIFDSTGTALQDVAAASIVYDRACADGVGVRIALGT